MKEEIPTTSPIRRSVRSRRKPSKLCDEAADSESDDVPLCSFVKTTLGWHTSDKRCGRVTENVTLDQEVSPKNGGNKKRGRPRKVKVSEMSENDSHTEAERGVPDEDCFGKVVPKVMENVSLNQEITTNIGAKKRGRPRKVKIIDMSENDSHTVPERLVANENSFGEDVTQVTENVTVSQDITTNGGAKRRGRPRKMKIIEMSGNDSYTEAERVIADEDCFEKDAPPVTENVTFNQEITTNGSTKKRGRPRKVKIIATSKKCSRTDAEKAVAEEVILRMPDPAIGDDQGKLGSVPRDEDGETRSTRRSLRRSRSVYYDQVANGGEAGEDADDPGRRKSHKKRRKRMVSETDQEMFKDVLTTIEDKLNAEGVVECHLCRKRRLTSQYAVVQHLKHNCPESKYLQTEQDTALKTKPLTSLNRLEFKKLAKKRGGKIECPTESCDRSFTTVDGLRYHLKRCGKELEMSFSCEHCDKKYSSWPGLSHHLRNWHAKKTPAVSDDADSDGETPETDNGGRRKRGAAKKAIEKLHEIAEKVETQEEGSVIEDGELYKEMASTKAILRLFKAPSSYRASSDVVRSWTLEIKQTGSAACPFCKRTFRSLFPIKMHVSSCKLRPGGNGVFTCLHCETECKSKKRMLHHLRQSHEEVVNLALKEALEEKKTQWEGVEEVEEEYEQEEGGETDEDDLIKSNEEDVKRVDQKRNSIVQIKKPVKWTQDYHKKYYCPGNESLFHRWKVDPKEWVELSESDSREYHPNAKESTAFIVEECRGTQSSERGECMALPLYGSISTEGKGAQLIFFVGGPVWAMDWCPSKSSNVQEDYVAISCYREMNNIQFYDQVEPHPGLIQIWNLSSLKNRMMSPTMALGIAHDFGHTNAMKWCPSGGYQSSDATEGGGGASRLGLLGAACSVGQVVIYAVPHPDQQYQQQSIYRPSPIAVLKPSRSDHWFGQCLCLDWSKQKGHSKVAAGFGNGCVALWNICTTSQFLVDQSNNIYPFQVLCVGHSILSAVSLNPSDDHFLLVVGSDRQTSVWDTRNPDCPLNDVSQCTSIDCCWPLYHNIGLVSTEKTGSTSKGCSVYMLDSGVLPFNSSVIVLNDTIWSFSISDWLHCLAAGAEDGKVGMTMYSSDGRNFKPGSKAMVISITAVEDKPTTVKKERSEEKQIRAEINQDTRKPNDKHDKNDSEGRSSSYKGNSAILTLSDDFSESTRNHPGSVSGTVESTTGYMCNSIKKTMEDNCSSITTEDISDSTGNTQGAISDSIENSKSIQGIISDSVETTRDIQGTISDSIESTRNIQGTISDSIESTRDMQGTISVSIENTRDLQGTISDSTESTRGSMCNSIKYAAEDNCNSIAKDDISDRIRETAKQAEKNDSLKKLGDSCSANAEDGGKIIDDSTQSVNEQLGKDFKERNLIEEGGTVDETQEVNSREPTMDISKEDAVRMPLLSEPAKAGTSPERQNTEKESFEIKKSDEVVGSRKHSVDATEHENTLKGNHNVECEQQPKNQTEDHMPSKHRTVESSAQSEKEPQVKENENTTELGASNSKEERSPKRELCIEDKEFDVQRILGQGDSNNESDDATGTTLRGQDLSKYKSKITSWRGHHDASDSEKCVVYKDYLENFINSTSWKSASRALLSRNVTTEEPEALIPLNAVTKLSWSPNYHSRQWLLIAGSNGIVRALQFKCFDHVKS